MAMKNDWGEKHCLRVIRKVCKEFDVPPCMLKYNTNKNFKRGFYRCWRQEVEVGQYSWRGTKATLAHEIAHHIAFRKSHAVRSRKENPHGKTFKYYLLRVVMVMYENCSDYPWDTEYPSVAKAWKNGSIG